MKPHEPTGTDADDRDDQRVRMRRGSLVDELGARHLAYRRAVERLRDRCSDTLAASHATATVPDQFRPADLSQPLRRVREAADYLDSARQALAEYDATGDND